MRIFGFTTFLLFSRNGFPESTLPGNSLFHLKSSWTDQDSRVHTLKNYQGKFVVLSLVYLSCKYTCPLTVQRIKDLEKQLSNEHKQKVEFLLFSFDPKIDSPQKLREFMVKRKLDPKHWALLTAPSDSEPRELAAALGFQYQRDEKGEFTHSFQITVLGKSGVPIAHVDSAVENLDSLCRGSEAETR